MSSQIEVNAVAYPDAAVPIVARTSKTPPVPCPFHRHAERDWEICIVVAGEARWRVSDRQINLVVGDVLVIGPDDGHSSGLTMGQRWVLMFNESLLREIPGEPRGDPVLGLQIEGVRLPRRFTVPDMQRGSLERILENLSEECVRRGTTKRSMCVTLLAELLINLARAAARTQGGERVSVPAAGRQVVLDLCTKVENEPGKPWTLDELSRHSGYGATQLTALFRAVKGVPPWRWLSEQRVRCSRHLLSTSDKSVADIALEAGFG
ncbi:MAG: helix-turn-helix domain-containing protein, partial [Lentisphaeria bacterium]|nr:helix-turn-helix domain-containing protein [Lentisphaeria bacterium]